MLGLIIRIGALLLIFSGLTACGGGGSSGGSGDVPGSRFITYNDNDNGEVILDASGDTFRILADSRAVYSDNRQAQIANTRVDDNEVLYLDGQAYGEIIKAVSSSGGEIAVFAWFDVTDSIYKYIDIHTAGSTQVLSRTQNRVPLPGNGGSNSDTGSGDSLADGIVLAADTTWNGQLMATDVSAYFRFIAQENGQYVLTLSGFDSSDLDLYIYGQSLQQIDSSTNESVTETIQLSAVAGQVYHIEVYAFDLLNMPQPYALSIQSPLGNGSPFDGDSTVSGVRWQLTDSCNDGYVIRLRFHEFKDSQRTGYQWPGGSSYYVLSGSQTFGLQCTPGTQICYGAENGDGSGDSWGISLSGDEGCESCCISCGTGTVTASPVNLICR